MGFSPAVRRVVCLFVLPVLPILIRRLEEEAQKTKNPYDDLGVQLLKGVYAWLREDVCK